MGLPACSMNGREVIGREASGVFLPLFTDHRQATSSNGYCAVIRDITQWKRTEEELRNAKRAAETANAHRRLPRPRQPRDPRRSTRSSALPT